MKRWIVAGGLAAVLAVALLTTFAFTGTEPVSTQDTDPIYDHCNQRLDASAFVPGVSREEGIDKAKAIAAHRARVPTPSTGAEASWKSFQIQASRNGFNANGVYANEGLRFARNRDLRMPSLYS